MECTSHFVNMGINYTEAIISMKLMKLTVWCADMEGGERSVRKSYCASQAEEQEASD